MNQCYQNISSVMMKPITDRKLRLQLESAESELSKEITMENISQMFNPYAAQVANLADTK